MQVLLIASAVASLLHADGPVSLAPRQAVGDVFEEKESSWFTCTTADLDSEGLRPSFGADCALAAPRATLSTRESHRTLQDEVLAVSDGRRTKVKRTFVECTSTSVEGDAPSARATRAPFEGQSIVVMADGEGTRLVGEIDGEDELSDGDRSLTSRWELVLPAAPVAIGTTWSLSEELTKRLLEGMNVTKGTVWCTLGEVDSSASGKPAKIQLDVRATVAAGAEETLELKASGTVLWSTEAGHLLEASLTGELQGTDADGNARTGKLGVTHEVRKLE